MGVGGGGRAVVLAENKATQPSLAGAWAELGKTQNEDKSKKKYATILILS